MTDSVRLIRVMFARVQLVHTFFQEPYKYLYRTYLDFI